MKTYLIIGNTLRDSMYCFDYMRRLLRDKIVRINQVNRFGNRADVLDCHYVERLLDTYSVLKGY